MSTIPPTAPSQPIAFLSGGFRPFFLFGAIQAAVSLALFVPWYLGFVAPPSLFPAPLWHAHELLFGFVPAVLAGFLTTAVPNWTKRPPWSAPRSPASSSSGSPGASLSSSRRGSDG